MTRYNLLFWLLALGFNNQVGSQIFYDTFDQIDQEKGISLLQNELDSLLDATSEPEIYLEMSHDFSVKFYKKGDFDAAIKYAQLETDFFEEHNIQNEKYTRALFQLGYFYELTAQFNLAIKLYTKVTLTAPNSIKAIQSYSKLGDCYYSLGNYFQAETYFLKSIAELENHDNPRLVASQYSNLSKVYHAIDTKDSRKKELEVLGKVLAINKNHPLTERTLSILFNNLANYYNNAGTYNFKKAKLYYKKLIENAIKNSDSIVIGAGYGNMGNLYIKEKKDSASYFLERSLHFPIESTVKSKVFRNMANYELQKNNRNNAITFLNKAIIINYLDKKIDPNNPTLQDLKDTDELTGVIAALSQKAEILLQINEESKDLSLVENAFKNLQTADSLIDYIKSSNREENSRLYWRKEASKVYHKAVYCSFLLNNYELAFTYSEKNKAILLTENIIENSFELPQSVKNRQNFLAFKLLEYENNIKNNTDSTLIQFYSKSLLNHKLAIKKHDDSIQKTYPALSQKIEDLKILSLQEVQKDLNSDEIVISYVWNKEVLFKDHLMFLIISQNNVELHELENASELSNDLSRLLLSLVNPFKTKEEKTVYSNRANIVFNKLFPNIELQKQLKGKKITIIADGQLQNLPFEALITNQETNRYFIEESQISYTYSLSFAAKNRALQREATQNLISFSPSDFKNTGLPKLFNTKKEVNSINNHIDGHSYVDSIATKEAFINQINNYNIIHLATHASSGDDAYLAFYDSKLSIKELYGLRNNAELVFLSACETSVGEIAQGEGTLTLARGFFNTGSRSVVSSLWKTSDKSTAFIVKEFYKNIESGHGVATSLHLSKIEYIKEHELSEVSPYYWSSLIAMGDNNVIPIKKTSYHIWILSLLTLLILISIFFYFYKKSN